MGRTSAVRMPSRLAAGSEFHLWWISGEYHRLLCRATNADPVGGGSTPPGTSRICDAGHKVVLASRGRDIQHGGTGQMTTSYMDHNVYRMEVEPAGFTWQGE